MVKKGNTWQFKMHAAQIPDLAKALVERDVSIQNLSKLHSLESLFLNLTATAEHAPNPA
jgi:hypothetical protein